MKNQFNHILILLEKAENEINENFIKKVNTIAKLYSFNKIFFLNTINELNFPNEILQDFPNIIENTLNERENELKKTIDKCFDSIFDKEVIIRQGNFLSNILKVINEKDIDLVFLEDNPTKKDNKVFLTRIVRRSPCSLIIFPNDYKELKINKILAPIDFSTFTQIAIESSIQIVEKSPNSEVIFNHIYNVPIGYHYTGKSFVEFKKIMKKNSEKKFQQYIKDYDLTQIKYQAKFDYDNNGDIIKMIYNRIQQDNIDLLMIGAKGLTSTAALFIGSNVEKLVHKNIKIPILILRKKGQMKNMFDFIIE